LVTSFKYDGSGEVEGRQFMQHDNTAYCEQVDSLLRALITPSKEHGFKEFGKWLFGC